MTSNNDTRAQFKMMAIQSAMVDVFRSDQTQGFSIQEIVDGLPEGMNASKTDILKNLRDIVFKGMVRQISDDSGRTLYIYIPDEDQSKFVQLNEDSARIYNIVESTGNKGIWRKRLRTLSKMEEKPMSNALSDLVNRKLIKEVSNLEGKKVYMLFNLQPSSDITGGVWYQSGSFNTALVDSLIGNAVNFVREKPKGVQYQAVVSFIRSSRIGNVSLSDAEAHQIVEACINSGAVTLAGGMLIAVQVQPPTCPVSRIPCRSCPVAHMCSPEGDINPVECPYLGRMTDFF